MKTLILAFTALLATGSVFAAEMPERTVIHDTNGFYVHLDVDKVLSSTDISQACGVIPARLNYLDHQGREHVLDYQVQGSGCINDN
ncbi:hypothetical protein CFN16_16180 [Pseudomonas fluorescens]|uniref:DUF2790 domain-containing protein n=1 Tax=Pseudomonas fluorescens TaxID=294 RepID=A0A345UYQ2_PSEFL|nr:DUF2790 domain-containing protein [Pseudomonas fluorescens]AXJ05604.1 hypothetical protein CFN16_16180 [Pseudomonas fluorescens]WJK07694.1 DUF2790 domain-containing protein [Pseudomonas fluorescens]